jgi:hypothetical protein
MLTSQEKFTLNSNMFLEPIQKNPSENVEQDFLLKKESFKIRNFETNILLSS